MMLENVSTSSVPRDWSSLSSRPRMRIIVTYYSANSLMSSLIIQPTEHADITIKLEPRFPISDQADVEND
jgi:hypothetical protein